MIGITAEEMRARADAVHAARAKAKADAKAQADAEAVANALKVIREGVQESAATGSREVIFGTRLLSTEALRSVIGHLRAAGFEVETLGAIGQPAKLEKDAGLTQDHDVFAALFDGVCQIRVSWAAKAKEPTP